MKTLDRGHDAATQKAMPAQFGLLLAQPAPSEPTDIGNEARNGDEPEPHSLLIFRLDDALYGLPLEQIVEVVEIAEAVPIPGRSQHVDAIMVHGDDILPLLRLRDAVGLDEKAEAAHAIVCQSDGTLVGLPVDEALRVAAWEAGQSEGTERGEVARPVQIAEHLVLLLDPDELIPERARAEARALVREHNRG